jgi:hypothetical protein
MSELTVEICGMMYKGTDEIGGWGLGVGGSSVAGNKRKGENW